MPLDLGKLRARREQLHLSQAAAASRASMRQPHWARLESGRHTNLRLSTLEQIAEALECTMTALMTADDRG